MIYSIQRYCIHDGRGIRTTVFFKGCNLRCGWCQNPESQSFERQLAKYQEKCIHCGACKKVCKHAERCILCGDCVYACPSEALTIYGWEITPGELYDEVMKDAKFYRKSSGGVTFSGGEPTLQLDFLVEILQMLKQSGVHTALESHGCFSKETRERLLPLVDQYLIDFKHSDGNKHREFTGVSNGLCIENLRSLRNRDVTMRIPLIPGFNDDDENLRQSALLARELGMPVHLLPFHKYGAAKYAALGREYAYANCRTHTQEEQAHMLSIFKDLGVRAAMGAGEE